MLCMPDIMGLLLYNCYFDDDCFNFLVNYLVWDIQKSKPIYKGKLVSNSRFMPGFVYYKNFVILFIIK